MSTLYILADIAVLVIGIMLVAQHYKEGWTRPMTLIGIALILLVLPSLLFSSSF